MFVVIHVKGFLLNKEAQKWLLCPYRVQSPLSPIYLMLRIPNCPIFLDQSMILHTREHSYPRYLS